MLNYLIKYDSYLSFFLILFYLDCQVQFLLQTLIDRVPRLQTIVFYEQYYYS
jgi:hypothetical protein